MEPNFRPKLSCKCAKTAKLSDSQFIQESNLKMTTNSKDTVNDNIPLTVRNMEDQIPKQHKPQKPCRKLDHKSDWSNSDDGKDDQARSNPIDILDPQPNISYARVSAPLRWPNTYPKVLNLERGRGKGKYPLENWTSVAKGHGHGIINKVDQWQTPSMQQEPEWNLAVVAPTDRIVLTDRIQTDEGEPSLTRPKNL